MGDNSFTKTYVDGAALTETQLDTAYKSVKLDLSNATLLTAGSTSGHYLKSTGDGTAPIFAAVPDPLSPSPLLRNYGLSVIASSSALVIRLKTNAGSDPNSTDKVSTTFSSNGSTTATWTAIDITSALSFSVTASATLGFSGTSTQRVFIYLINNAGTPKFAVSRRGDFDAGAAITTVAMAASADSAASLYATAALTVIPRLLGWADTSQNSAGQWQTPSKTNVISGAFSILDNGRADAVATSAKIGGFARSSSSGNFTTSATSFTDITNLSVTITTSGRPVQLMLVPDGTTTITSAARVGTHFATSGGTGDPISFIQALRGTSTLGIFYIEGGTDQSAADSRPVSTGTAGISFIDFPSAGTHTFKLQGRGNTGNDELIVQYCKLIAYEIR